MAINQAAGRQSVGELPDIWPSREGSLGNVITKGFCWSHAVQRAPGEPLVPPTPQNVDDREPGAEMYILIGNKLSAPGPQALATALAFMGHNAADREVHYGYFLGGSIFNWWRQHAWKEEWADYMIYTERLGGGFSDRWVTDDPETGAGHWVYDVPTLRITVKCSGDADLIQLAQRVYHKNRFSTDIGLNGVEAGLTVETTDGISGRMTAP